MISLTLNSIIIISEHTHLLEDIILFLGGERERALLRLAELGRLLVKLLLALLEQTPTDST